MEAIIETGVDALIRFLKDNGKVSLKEASTKLKIPEQTLQLWLDFLVEERVIGMEYKFTKPYIFLNKEVGNTLLSSEDETVTIELFKNEYFKNAREKKIPEDQIKSLWQAHLIKDIDNSRAFFEREAKKRSFEDIDKLFIAYKKRLLGM